MFNNYDELPQINAMQSVYSYRPTLYLQNTPLWSETYSYCTKSDTQNTSHRTMANCLSLQFPFVCTVNANECELNDASCLVTDSILGPR